MRNSFKNTKKRGFLQLFSNAQNINNYILLNSRISCIFSAFYKICLCYLCYERLHYLSEKVKERKNGFSQNYQQNLALGALKCVSDGIFTPQKGKNTGVKGRLEGRKWLFSGIILTYLQDKQHINKRRKRRNPQLKGVLKNTKRNILRCRNNVYPLNYQHLKP